MRPEVDAGIRVKLPDNGQCAGVLLENDVCYPRNLSWRTVTTVGLSTIVLHDNRSECVGDASNARLCSRCRDLLQRSRVIGLLTRRIENQNGACGHPGWFPMRIPAMKAHRRELRIPYSFVRYAAAGNVERGKSLYR